MRANKVFGKNMQIEMTRVGYSLSSLAKEMGIEASELQRLLDAEDEITAEYLDCFREAIEKKTGARLRLINLFYESPDLSNVHLLKVFTRDFSIWLRAYCHLSRDLGRKINLSQRVGEISKRFINILNETFAIEEMVYDAIEKELITMSRGAEILDVPLEEVMTKLRTIGENHG